MAMKRKRLGEMLLEESVVTEAQIEEALSVKRTTEKLGDTLLRLGHLTEQQLIEALHHQLKIPVIQLYNYPVDVAVTKLISKELAQRHTLVPVYREGNRLFIAMADPMDLIAIDDLRLQTGLMIEVGLATRDEIRRTILKYYDIDSSLRELLESDEMMISDTSRDTVTREDAPIIRLVNQMLENGISQRASDIHMDPQETSLSIRIRIDGELRTENNYPKQIQNILTTRIKVMSELDITESRLPQDGRIKFLYNGVAYDFRVSTLPTVYGEKVVIRILDSSNSNISIAKIGFSERNEHQFREMLKRPNGIILITGPTGSGKSSTLYAALNELNDETRNIITVEDPVEYQVDGINQVQVNSKIGLTFASGLRSILRQDPNVVMVGEIRDIETAEISIRASLTGHLVLSTLHTNSAVSSITRLIDMGVEPFLVAASVTGLIAQRLVRRVCRDCGEVQPLSKREEELFAQEGISATTVMRGRGCSSCNMTGYRGRLAIQEVVMVDESLRRMIMNQSTESEITMYVRSQGQRLLLADGLAKVAQGITTTEEILRTVISE
ncbi:MULTISPECIES: GspE/PulE family protein [Exiguobacterium]|uniref:GspE/PulE family protein n=1 Tax=Exiguobacterium TaxID=33986 RepID=UPI00047B0027|nr:MULTISPECIES: ATPase, T2SS/T4P/T4SS family [Exiguobacterium]MCT4778760.1 ATPase, T2SS/T4P/T4SS family [Exiguobacterium soli]